MTGTKQEKNDSSVVEDRDRGDHPQTIKNENTLESDDDNGSEVPREIRGRANT